MSVVYLSHRSEELLADTYESGTRGYGCRGGRQVADKSLIQAVVKLYVTHQRGYAVWSERLHGEPRAHHWGGVQVQMHVLPKGRELIVQRRREGPPAAMASPGHIVRQVSPLRVHLHRGYNHIVWGTKGHIKVPAWHAYASGFSFICDRFGCLWLTLCLTSCLISFCNH